MGHEQTVTRSSASSPAAVVLGGGGGRGLAHIGVWRAIQERGIAVERVVGTSAGALIGASIASGLTAEELTARAKRLARGSVFSLDPRILFRGARNPSLLKDEPLRTLIHELVPVDRFDELALPLSVNAIDLTTGEVVWFGEGGRMDIPVADAVYASCALPFLLPPAAIDGSLYIDAGILAALPVSHAQALGASRIIAVDLGSKAAVTPERAGLFDTYRRVFEILRPEESSWTWGGAEVIRIHPSLSVESTFDLSRAEAMIESGYRASLEVLPESLPDVRSVAPAEGDPRRKRPPLHAVPAVLDWMATAWSPRAEPSKSLVRSA